MYDLDRFIIDERRFFELYDRLYQESRKGITSVFVNWYTDGELIHIYLDYSNVSFYHSQPVIGISESMKIWIAQNDRNQIIGVVKPEEPERILTTKVLPDES